MQDKVILESWMPELQVRHEYEVQSVSGKWQKQVFKPDAFLRLQAGERLFPFFVEWIAATLPQGPSPKR